jgi:hypothetical protein
MKTAMIADDFAYCYSFADGQKIDSIKAIVSSMIAHRQYMNGRVIAHFLVQLFLMLPPVIFKLFNSAVFTLTIYIIYRIAMQHEENNLLVLAGIFGCTWIYMPSFGQSILWLDGSINYLWSAVFSLALISVYAAVFMRNYEIKGAWNGLLIAFAFAVGAYSEPSATATIFCCTLLLILDKLVNKRKMQIGLVLAIIAAFVGFLFMVIAPGELNNKAATMTISGVSYGFVNALEMYRQIWVLLLIYIAEAFICQSGGVNLQRQLLALTLALGSLAAVFVLSFAGYAEGRSACFGTFVIIAADAALLPELFKSKYKNFAAYAVIVCIIATVYWGGVGVQDICESHAQQTQNEQIIIAAKNDENQDVSLPQVTFRTKYSAGYGLTYLSSDPYAWVNSYMAQYYGVETIVAIKQ